MTKPRAIAVGIGVAGMVSTGLVLVTTGVGRIVWAWITVACAIACAAYLGNRPAWLGKRGGRTRWLRALPVLPYLVAFRIACAIMRWRRPPDTPTEVAPGLWVSGRVRRDLLPPDVELVLDLTAEFSAPRSVRRLPGYRNLPVLDGGFPDDEVVFLDAVREAAEAVGAVLVHCDSGRGRAPTMAAAILVARGLARDVDEAVALLRASRPVVAPTRSDLLFLARIAGAVRRDDVTPG